MDHIHGSVAERGHVQVPIGTRDDVRDDAEISTGDEARALALVEFVVVVVNSVPQFRIAEGEVLPVVVKRELEQIPTVEERSRGADKQIAGVLSAISIFLVGTVPNALGIFMRTMATSLRTIAP